MSYCTENVESSSRQRRQTLRRNKQISEHLQPDNGPEIVADSKTSWPIDYGWHILMQLQLQNEPSVESVWNTPHGRPANRERQREGPFSNETLRFGGITI